MKAYFLGSLSESTHTINSSLCTLKPQQSSIICTCRILSRQFFFLFLLLYYSCLLLVIFRLFRKKFPAYWILWHNYRQNWWVTLPHLQSWIMNDLWPDQVVRPIFIKGAVLVSFGVNCSQICWQIKSPSVILKTNRGTSKRSAHSSCCLVVSHAVQSNHSSPGS